MMRSSIKISLFLVLLFFGSVFPVNTVFALNKTANWNFNGNATGWTAINGTANGAGSGNPSCGTSADALTVLMTTFAYSGSLSSETAFQATTASVKNTDYRGHIYQTVVAPGSGTVKAKGKFSYYGNSTNWGTGKVSLDVWNSLNTSFVAELRCILFSADVAWTTASFGSDVSLTGGTTYAVRTNLVSKTRSNSNTAITLGVDNIVFNFSPTGLAATGPADGTNAQLDWTTSVAGSGANGVHATTPYKIYRDDASPVTTFLANGTTNTYTDSSTAGNTTYFYAISDVDTASEESPLSAEVSILTRPDTPGTPTFSNLADTSVTVNWSAPSGGAEAYKIERCTGSSCSDFSQIASGVSGTTYNDSGLTQSTVYRYRIRATNATGDGQPSSIGETTTNTSVVISVTLITDGTVSYGTLSSGQSSTTLVLSDSQVVQNDGNIAEDFNIKTSAPLGWTLDASSGLDTFMHEFSTNGGSSWTPFTTADSYQSLVSNIAVSGTQTFDLRFTAPNPSTSATQKTINITIQAVAH